MQVVVVGEAYGEQEEKVKAPFIGKSGQELTRIMRDGGVLRSECFLTNVFNERPPGNRVQYFFAKKNDLPAEIEFPNPAGPGLYLKPEYYHHLYRLYEELREHKPNLIIALGNTALWALTSLTGITKYRGTICDSEFGKVLPTFHPAAVMRQWKYRPLVVVDMMKAAHERNFPEIRRPKRTVWLEPSIDDLHAFEREHLQNMKLLSFDIETKPDRRLITCISFAPTPYVGITVPFVDRREDGYHYWVKEEDEVEAWSTIKRWLESPVPKLGQNGMGYDMFYLYFHGIQVRNYCQDTMLEHHAIQPEMAKDLGTMGSIYTNEVAWKTMRPRGAKKGKREDE